MDLSTDRVLTRLDKGTLQRIEDANGKGVAVFDGSVWITQDNDPLDHFLEEGESLVFERAGLVIVQALVDSRLMVFEAEPAALRHAA